MASSFNLEHFLRVLQLPYRTLSLPLTTICPLCGQPKLTLYHDSTATTPWYHCGGCESAGDCVELLAAVKNGTTAEASETVGVLYRPEDDQNRKRYRDARLVWAEHAGKQKPISAAHFSYLGAHLAMSPQRWWETVGAGVAIIPAKSLMRFTSRPLPSPVPLLVPCTAFVDLPGRIVGFGAVWNKMRGQKDDTVRRIIPVREGTRQPSGFAFLPQALRSAGPIIGVSSWEKCAGLSGHWYRLYPTPAPFFAWPGDAADPDDQAWQMLSGREVVLWTTSPVSWQSFRLAARHNVRIAAYADLSVTGRRLGSFVSHGLADKAAVLAGMAKPWRSLLEDTINKLSTEDADVLVTRLHAAGVDVADVDRIPLAVSGTAREHFVSVGGLRVLEKDGKWQTKSGTVVTNFVFRIHRIVTSGDVKFATGSLYYNGKKYEFAGDLREIEKDAATWFYDFGISQQIGAFYVADGWTRRVLKIATALSCPTVTADKRALQAVQQSLKAVTPAFVTQLQNQDGTRASASE
jgi:hypothetical protein